MKTLIDWWKNSRQKREKKRKKRIKTHTQKSNNICFLSIDWERKPFLLTVAADQIYTWASIAFYFYYSVDLTCSFVRSLARSFLFFSLYYYYYYFDFLFWFFNSVIVSNNNNNNNRRMRTSLFVVRLSMYRQEKAKKCWLFARYFHNRLSDQSIFIAKKKTKKTNNNNHHHQYYSCFYFLLITKRNWCSSSSWGCCCCYFLYI